MNPATFLNAVTEEEKSVLRVLRDRDSDGYSLLRNSKLAPEKIEEAVNSLIGKGLVNVEGNPRGPELNFAYMWVKPEARGYADYVTGRAF